MAQARAAGRPIHHLRPLTEGEIALCRSVFPDDLPYAAVRLCDGPAVNDIAERAFGSHAIAITLRRTIYFKTGYHDDFSAGDESARRLFVHEMTHVWQWWRLGVIRFLSRYLIELIACRGNPLAMYLYDDDRPFSASRLEAQAEMVGDYQRERGRRSGAIAAKLRGSGFYGL